EEWECRLERVTRPFGRHRVLDVAVEHDVARERHDGAGWRWCWCRRGCRRGRPGRLDGRGRGGDGDARRGVVARGEHETSEGEEGEREDAKTARRHAFCAAWAAAASNVARIEVTSMASMSASEAPFSRSHGTSTSGTSVQHSGRRASFQRPQKPAGWASWPRETCSAYPACARASAMPPRTVTYSGSAEKNRSRPRFAPRFAMLVR